jgi:hypothetical protein
MDSYIVLLETTIGSKQIYTIFLDIQKLATELKAS